MLRRCLFLLYFDFTLFMGPGSVRIANKRIRKDSMDQLSDKNRRPEVSNSRYLAYIAKSVTLPLTHDLLIFYFRNLNLYQSPSIMFSYWFYRTVYIWHQQTTLGSLGQSKKICSIKVGPKTVGLYLIWWHVYFYNYYVDFWTKAP